MFTQALVSPTENSVAQANWAARKLPAFEVDPRHLRTPRSYEARCWESFRAGDWDSAIAEAWKWLADEPFSRRPAELGTFTALVPTERFEDAVQMARLALVANPDDPLLLNNLAVGLASMGKVEEAVQTYARINPSGLSSTAQLVAYHATGGLIAFRTLAPELGRELYGRALDVASGESMRHERATAFAFWAREEFQANSPTAHHLLARAREEVGDTPPPALDAFLVRMEARMVLRSAAQDGDLNGGLQR
jgi:tetratricopeptide (TPR) repeat protein